MIDVTIDGITIQTLPGKTVMEVALENGIDIPRLCYHPELSVAGGCRLCQVEVEGWSNPTASCGLACQDGMKVQTRTEKEAILYALKETNNNKARAAKMLGIHRTLLYKKMRKNKIPLKPD